MRLWRFGPALLLLLQPSLWGAQVTISSIGSPEQQVQLGAKISFGTAQELEAQVERNPEDLAARAKLLGFYYYQWMRPGEVAAKAARRRHILWLIEHHPESPLTGMVEASLDENGDSMADPEGYQQARKLWLAQVDAPASAAALGNLSRFFQIVDKDLAEKALLKARALQPQSYEWQWRLGYLYGLGILGVESLGLNGQPTSSSPYAQKSPFAAKSAAALAESTSGVMLESASSFLLRYGMILTPSPQQKLDYIDQAIQFMRRAATIEPANPNWALVLLRLEAYKRQLLSIPAQGK